MLPDNSSVIDIGANIGIMTVHFAKKLRNSVVYAVEPVSENMKALERIIMFYRLKNVKTIKSALGDQNGEIEMVLPIIKSVKMQGLSHVLHPQIEGYENGDRFKVCVQKLDDLFLDKISEKPLKAIKIDVENYEYFVLLGAKELLKRYHPYLYMELWDNDNREKCFKLLAEIGYRTKVIHKGKLIDFDKSTRKTQNFFFLPPEKS